MLHHLLEVRAVSRRHPGTLLRRETGHTLTGQGWRSTGSKVKELFGIPYDLSVDDAGRIYILDAANNRIVRIDDLTGKNPVTFGTKGTGVGQFDNPRALFVR